MSNDLEDDWSAIRGVGLRAPELVPRADHTPEYIDLEGDWATLRNLPEYAYVTRQQDASFHVWRLRVHGERRLRNAHGSTRTDLQDHWIVSYDKVLFSHGAPVKTPDGQRYTVEKQLASLELSDVAGWIDAFQRKHVNELRQAITVWELEITQREQWIRSTRDKIAQLGQTNPQFSAPSLVRADLLSVLQQRAENLKRGEEQRKKIEARQQASEPDDLDIDPLDINHLWDQV